MVWIDFGEGNPRKRKCYESGWAVETLARLWNSVQRQQIGFQTAGESMKSIKPGIQKPPSLPRCAIMASLLWGTVTGWGQKWNRRFASVQRWDGGMGGRSLKGSPEIASSTRCPSVKWGKFDTETDAFAVGAFAPGLYQNNSCFNEMSPKNTFSGITSCFCQMILTFASTIMQKIWKGLLSFFQ
jgi:hypothetical protein